jgi:hypothetical protein
VPAFLAGVLVGAAIAAVIGGPLAVRVSARLEARWDRAAESPASGLDAMIGRLAADEALFSAYLRQFWTWAALVAGTAAAVVAGAALLVWALVLRGAEPAAGVVAALAALVAAGAAIFLVRKLIQKRRLVRQVYLRRLR